MMWVEMPGVENALGKIKSKTFVIGIKTDILFPIEEQRFLAKNIEGASFLKLIVSTGMTVS